MKHLIKFLYLFFVLIACSHTAKALEWQGVHQHYAYDANVNLSIADESLKRYEKRVYDGVSHFSYSTGDEALKFQQEKTLHGSFFAFEASFVAAKGGGKFVFRGDTRSPSTIFSEGFKPRK